MYGLWLSMEPAIYRAPFGDNPTTHRHEDAKSNQG